MAELNPPTHMQLTPFTLLIGIAIILAVMSLIKPTWPLLSVAVIMVCTALLIGKT